MTLVTISALYGAGGSQVAPRVAARLGVPFLGRPPVPEPGDDRPDRGPESSAGDEWTGAGAGRLLSRIASLAVVWGTPAGITTDELLPDQARRREIEREILALAATGGGVVLGRGAVAVLHDDRRALHVLLEGPAEARVRQGMRIEGVGRAPADANGSRSPRVPRGPLRRRPPGPRRLPHAPGLHGHPARRVRRPGHRRGYRGIALTGGGAWARYQPKARRTSAGWLRSRNARVSARGGIRGSARWPASSSR
jgi:hypothetical protein